MKVNSNLKSTGFLFLIFIIVAVIWSIVGSYFFNEDQKNEEVIMFNNITANLIVDSVNETIEFYKSNFGFEVLMTVPEAGELDWAQVNKDNVNLMFQKKVGLAEDPLNFENKETGGTFTLFIEVSGLDELYEKVKANCEIIVDLNTTFYGMREVTFKDLNGYVITFAEKVADQ